LGKYIRRIYQEKKIALPIDIMVIARFPEKKDKKPAWISGED